MPCQTLHGQMSNAFISPCRVPRGDEEERIWALRDSHHHLRALGLVVGGLDGISRGGRVKH